MDTLRSDSVFASAFRNAQSSTDSKHAQTAQETEYVMKRVATLQRVVLGQVRSRVLDTAASRE
jgi:hypothetical protein